MPPDKKRLMDSLEGSHWYIKLKLFPWNPQKQPQRFKAKIIDLGNKLKFFESTMNFLEIPNHLSCMIKKGAQLE